MNFDKSLCKVRLDNKLPCYRCIFFNNCDKKDVIQVKNAEIPQKTINSIKTRKRKWSDFEISVVKNEYITTELASKILCRSAQTIYHWRQRNGIKGPTVRNKKKLFSQISWTPDEDILLEDQRLSNSQIALLLKRSHKAVELRRRKIRKEQPN